MYSVSFLTKYIQVFSNTWHPVFLIIAYSTYLNHKVIIHNIKYKKLLSWGLLSFRLITFRIIFLINWLTLKDQWFDSHRLPKSNNDAKNTETDSDDHSDWWFFCRSFQLQNGIWKTNLIFKTVWAVKASDVNFEQKKFRFDLFSSSDYLNI